MNSPAETPIVQPTVANAGTDLEKIISKVRELTERADSFYYQMQVTFDSLNESITELNEKAKAVQSFFSTQHTQLEDSYQAKCKQLAEEHARSVENLAATEKIIYGAFHEMSHLLTVISNNFAAKETL